MKNKLNESGYLLIPNFFDHRELDGVMTDVRRIFATQMLHHGICKNVPEDLGDFEKCMFGLFTKQNEAFINCGKQAQHLVSLWRICTGEKLVRLLHECGLTFPNISVRPSMFFNSRHLDNVGHYWKLESHQDWRSSQGSLDSVTVWYPFVDCDAALGALEVLPGSHKGGLRESSETDYYSKINESALPDNSFVQVEMKKGDLLLFNGLTVHRSGTNSTDRVRWSSQLRFNNLDEPSFVERNYPNPYTYKPFPHQVTPGFPGAADAKLFFSSSPESE